MKAWASFVRWLRAVFTPAPDLGPRPGDLRIVRVLDIPRPDAEPGEEVTFYDVERWEPTYWSHTCPGSWDFVKRYDTQAAAVRHWANDQNGYPFRKVVWP